MYGRLDEALKDADVLFNASGVNLHPEYLATVEKFVVFQCFDDPENSHNLSAPVAHAYDLCLVGNAAEVDTYRSWGARRAAWSPMGVMPGFWDPTMPRQLVEDRDSRDIDVLVVADFNFPARRERLRELVDLLPQGRFHGPGAPHGFLPQSEFLPTLRRTRIGLNLHNSTGPINLRTFYLPANGVMQICDNAEHLGMAFDIGTEVVAADNPEDMAKLVRKYLEDVDAQRDIAIGGWERARRDYTEEAVFSRTMSEIREAMTDARCSREARSHAISSRKSVTASMSPTQSRLILGRATAGRRARQFAAWKRSRRGSK
jgi:hypothetical protein